MLNLIINQRVWILAGQFADKPMQGIILSVSNIDNKGINNTYCDIKTEYGLKHTNINQIFNHKPKRVIKKDCFGNYTTWE